MQQIVYVSEAAPDMHSGEVFKIIERSAAQNAKRGLTGFLLYSGGRFLQLLEGERETIDDVMQRIGSDKRHHSLRIVLREPVPARAFPKWTMKRVAATGDNNDIARAFPAIASAGEPVAHAISDFLAEGLELHRAQR